MATAQSIYLGDLRTRAKHIQSGTEIITDAPLDNQGKGEAFSPTDLLATSLGSCMLTIMGIAARTHGFSINETTIEITKIMTDHPRKVAEIHLKFAMPPIDYSAHQKKILLLAATTCPVALSLHPDISQKVEFAFNDELVTA